MTFWGRLLSLVLLSGLVAAVAGVRASCPSVVEDDFVVGSRWVASAHSGCSGGAENRRISPCSRSSLPWRGGHVEAPLGTPH